MPYNSTRKYILLGSFLSVLAFYKISVDLLSGDARALILTA